MAIILSHVKVPPRRVAPPTVVAWECKVWRAEVGGDDGNVGAPLAPLWNFRAITDDLVASPTGSSTVEEGGAQGRVSDAIAVAVEVAVSTGSTCTEELFSCWPFRLPAVLVGDGRLGGISATISAYETLRLRGYDVIAVILENRCLSNETPLLSYLRNRVHVLVLPPIPEDMKNSLMDWFCESSKIFSTLQEIMLSAHLSRIQRFHIMPKKAGDILWWPFTQHGLVPEETVTLIDSRCGENFAIH